MKETTQLLKISVVAVIIVLAANYSWAADKVKTVQNVQAPSRTSAVEPPIKVFAPASQSQSSVPVDPTGLTAVCPLGTQVILTWKDMSSNELNFEMERRTGNGSFEKHLTGIQPNITTVTDKKVDQNTTYTYRIHAWNQSGFSPYSNEATVTIKLPATAGEIIQCPAIGQGKLKYMVYSASVPQGWNAPDYASTVKFVFNSASVLTNALICSFSTPVGTASITRAWPSGKTCKAIDGKYFICE